MPNPNSASYQTPRPGRRTATEAPATPSSTLPRFIVARELSEAQRTAIDLYHRGFNVAPVKPASKEPFLWRVLAGTRVLSPQEDYARFVELFDKGAGICVLTGRLSMNLTILDCETRTAARRHETEFAKRSLKPWIVETANGFHYWWLSSDGEIDNVPGRDGQDWEVRGNLRYCLAPPSVHPTGAIYQWHYREGDRPPLLSIAQLDWLPLELAIKARGRFEPQVDSDPLSPLARQTRDFIEHGAAEGTRNNRLFRAACDLNGNGFTIAEARVLLMPACEKSGIDQDGQDNFSRAAIERTVQSAYRQDRRPSRPNAKPTAMPRWLAAAEWAKAHAWTKLSGHIGKRQVSVSASTARQAFAACCERARRDDTEVFRASVREIAELANLTSKTANKALHCLNESGYIGYRGRTDFFGANEFTLTRPSAREWNNTPPWTVSSVVLSRGWLTGQFSDARADVFSAATRERKGLGKTAERVWELLLTEQLRQCELARRLSAHPHTVKLALVKLEEVGLAQRLEGRRWVGVSATNGELQRIAGSRQTHGRAAARRAHHALERRRYVTQQILRAKARWERSLASKAARVSSGGEG